MGKTSVGARIVILAGDGERQEFLFGEVGKALHGKSSSRQKMTLETSRIMIHPRWRITAKHIFKHVTLACCICRERHDHSRRSASGLALAGGLFAHSHQATQAFRKDGFETKLVHIKWLGYSAQVTPKGQSTHTRHSHETALKAEIQVKVTNLTFGYFHIF
jgi:hypothetical protein